MSMTNEEAITELRNLWSRWQTRSAREGEAVDLAIAALSPDRRTDDAFRFCEWVAEEIFDENWEYNTDAFAEIACRKLEKMGIVKLIGENWELIESEESNADSD